MADEMKKLEQELKKFSTRFEKSTNDWMKYVDSESDKVVKFVRDNTKDLSDTIARERKKIELRSQIGEHTRSLNKSYIRLGEAYYESLKSGREMDDMSDVLTIIESKRRLVELLNEQLGDLEQKSK